MTATGPLSTPAVLADLVAFQSGSVVSRTLRKSTSGSLTLFAFDVGEGLSEHTTPHDATVLVLEGTANISVAGVSHRVSAPEALLLPGGIPHALQAPERFKMLLVVHRTDEPQGTPR